jgi:hypothetical protein
MEKFPIGWELADLAETRQIPSAIQTEPGRNRFADPAKGNRVVILGFSFENMGQESQSDWIQEGSVHQDQLLRSFCPAHSVRELAL